MRTKQQQGPLVWEQVQRGHWRHGKWDLVRHVEGQSSIGMTLTRWRSATRDYPSLEVTWWIYENGKRGPKPCRSLEHAQRCVVNRIEGETRRRAEREARAAERASWRVVAEPCIHELPANHCGLCA